MITMEELYERNGWDTNSLDWLDKTIREEVMAIKQLKVGEKVLAKKNRIKKNSNPNNIQFFYRYIERLKDEGDLDIGKGGCEYGFSIPLPEKTGSGRKLILYRRS